MRQKSIIIMVITGKTDVIWPYQGARFVQLVVLIVGKCKPCPPPTTAIYLIFKNGLHNRNECIKLVFKNGIFI